MGVAPPLWGIPVTDFPPDTEIIRAPEGGTLLIPCNNSHNTNKQVSHIAIPPAFTYNGILVAVPADGINKEPHNEVNYCCNCTKEFIAATAGNRQIPRRWLVPEYDLVTGAFSIALENFSYVYTGLYECLHSNGSQLVVTHRYWVSATLFRHNVFNPPMKSVTVHYGHPAAMVCPVRFNFLPGYLMTRFLWRKGSLLLLAQSVPEMKGKVTSPFGFKGEFKLGVSEPCLCNATMSFYSVTYEDAGLYECWFRINDRLDEWIAQEAYLHVI
ncbi:uncharacterized protein LOC129594046 [Paramacrobiotus metropolitanus]|uniref:uncharacterized protein LOC129594046 n=1 Tax=Paramacrobiotus metropolitanus TaxID=2943436 RepID=UPI002445E415|nr:uncharacterized protein LOC129594046 [Paramacrobiotus metropolitanus]